MSVSASDRPIRVALVCDYLEERWASMDLVAEMVGEHLARGHAGEVAVTTIRPPFRRRAMLVPAKGRVAGAAWNADRALNRMVDYPRALRAIDRRERFDLYHLVDHSYSQLVHALPPGRAVVTCHDLDTFRCLLEPALEPRPGWFRGMTRRILTGLQRAAAVACDSAATLGAIRRYGLLPADRLRVVYLAVHPECSPEPDPAADAEAARLLGPDDPAGGPTLLHVGTNIPRKRIDVLIDTFAAVRRVHPGARLVKVGGAFTPEQEGQARSLGVLDAITFLPPFSPRSSRDRAALAAVYRRADLVLQPSDAEGFGLPVAEALACGTLVLASDLPVLREVGGDAAVYRPVGDVPAWSAAAIAMLDERRGPTEAWHARRRDGLEQASKFRWTTHVAQLVEIYRDVLAKAPPSTRSSAVGITR